MAAALSSAQSVMAAGYGLCRLWAARNAKLPIMATTRASLPMDSGSPIGSASPMSAASPGPVNSMLYLRAVALPVGWQVIFSPLAIRSGHLTANIFFFGAGGGVLETGGSLLS